MASSALPAAGTQSTPQRRLVSAVAALPSAWGNPHRANSRAKARPRQLPTPHPAIDWAITRIGLGSDAHGVFTRDELTSTLHALRLAHQETRYLGHDDSELRVLTTDAARHHVAQAAEALGLTPQAVMGVDTDAAGRMDPEALRHALAVLEFEGHFPLAVVATATPSDREDTFVLAELAAICSLQDVWFHVDTSGKVELAATNQHLPDGIGCADSVTIRLPETDFPMPANTAVLLASQHEPVFRDCG